MLFSDIAGSMVISWSRVPAVMQHQRLLRSHSPIIHKRCHTLWGLHGMRYGTGMQAGSTTYFLYKHQLLPYILDSKL